MTKRGKGVEDWLQDYFFLREELDEVSRRKIDSVRKNKFELAAVLRDNEKKLLRRYESLNIKIKANL